MALARSLSIRIAAIWAIFLALGGGLDLHFSADSASAAHGVVDGSHGRSAGEDVFVAAESCTQQESRHIEAAERRFLSPCPLCLRNHEKRALATTSALRAANVSASESRFHDPGRAPAGRPFTPNPVRGPPIA